MRASELLEIRERRVKLSRSGLVSLARLACEAVQSGRTAVLVAADRTSFSQLAALASLFSPSMSCAVPPLASPAWEQPLALFPQGLLVRDDFLDWPQRLASLYALSMKQPRVVVASVESLVLRWPSPDALIGNSLLLQAGEQHGQEEFVWLLSGWGYIRVPMVARSGEMARRGDILDVYAPGLRHPVRLEFFDDTLEEIRLFDADSQHSLEQLSSVTLLPARPWVQDEKGLESMRAYVQELSHDGRIGDDMAYDCLKALEGSSKTLLPGSVLPGCVPLTDWLPRGTMYFCAGERDTRDAFAACADELAGRLYGDRAPVLQSAELCLMDAESLPWERDEESRVFFAEPLVMGVADEGLSLAERPLRSFQELFTDPGAVDRPWQHTSALLKKWRGEKRQTILSFSSERNRKNFLKLAAQDGFVAKERYTPWERGVFALISPFRTGCELVWDNSCVLGEKVLMPGSEKTARVSNRVFKGMDVYEGLTDGELLVHREYGIGRFRGLESIDVGGVPHDCLVLEYQGADKLYVPVDKLGCVQRYRSAEGDLAPSLDRLGGAVWSSCRDRARKAVEKIAGDLMEMYAYRKVAKGFRYDPPDELCQEFEASFPYEETPDQAKAIEDVYRDMERAEPMDRLICGDVGFGKTEVAMRAAFRAASNGRQVALLCPTTVLAEQHYQTFRERMNGFPLRIGLLSRFVPPVQQKKVVRAAEEGKIDILIGTHRLLSADVHLPNLGLLVLDEEQRFGVRHKESLKELRRNVDVLTLTATPIPRTLQLSMSGIRELSLIETPPRERKPVATAVLERDEKVLRDVLRRELDRHGQVFWVYNRVQGLAGARDYVSRLVPDARVAMAHGQMPEDEVETTMRRFWHGELDVLVCTSIIESGLDFPRANTLIVDQAQKFGLGQLYQLRGRVGRSDRQAYAYFVVPDVKHMTDIAQERLRILQDMDFLGAGFKVAMEDLRLRGAGNILGEAQTGQMTRIGLELYLEMLEQAVERIKGTEAVREKTCEINIGVSARIPETYITDGQERLRQYRALTAAATGQERERISLGLRDRFGPFPEEFQTFLAILDFKQFLSSLQVERADLARGHVKLTWSEGQSAVDPIKIIRLMQETKGSQMVPPATLLLPIAADLPYREVLPRLRSVLEGLRLEKNKDGAPAKSVVLVSTASRRRGMQGGAPRNLGLARSLSFTGKGGTKGR